MSDITVDPLEMAGRAYSQSVRQGDTTCYMDYLSVLFDLKAIEFYVRPLGWPAKAREISAEGLLSDIEYARNRIEIFVSRVSAAYYVLAEQGVIDAVRGYEHDTLCLLEKAKTRLTALEYLSGVLTRMVNR